MERTEDFTCPRCGNSDPDGIGIGPTGRPYCRLCLQYDGREAPAFTPSGQRIQLSLTYPLSPAQRTVSDQVLAAVTKGQPVLIKAVTGAGKTELVYAAMEHFLSRGLAVGFATPRKDVVIELEPRIHEAFPMATITSVYGEHTQVLSADIIVLTTHQLYRYPNYFDLLILDEIDAFPYAGNQVLKHFFRRSVKGVYILLSATPSQTNLEELEKDKGVVINLDIRYHGQPLPVPQIRLYGPFGKLDIIACLRDFLSAGKPCFVFAPTISKARRLADLLRLFCLGGASVDSQDPDRERKIADFKAGKLSYLVCTAVLERGVTVRDLQVIVADADHPIYDAAALIQIAGRAGRKSGYEDGEVIFFCHREEPWVKEAVSTIEETNHHAAMQSVPKKI